MSKDTSVMSSRRSPSLRLFMLIVAFYAASTLNSCLTKQLIQQFPRPLTVSLAQQMLATVGGLARVASIRRALHDWRALLPLAVTLFTSLVLYRISLLYNSLSFAQAIKTLQPLFAALLSSLLLRERSSPRRVCALMLLLCGVCVATTTELSFSAIGFACTVAACFAQALQAVLSKSLLVHNQLPPEDVFAAAAVYTLLLLAPVWLILDLPSLAAGEPPRLIDSGAVWLLVLNGVCNFATQLLSFAVLCAFASPVRAAALAERRTERRCPAHTRAAALGGAIYPHPTMLVGYAAADTTLAMCVGARQEHQRTEQRSPEASTPHIRSPLVGGPPSLALNPRRGRHHASPAGSSSACGASGGSRTLCREV